ncbi:flagella basal body P-ring formation protein FlgA [Novosphingobium chloroacetimidivorans]|uniref:Flagella basal body P-ring formation protein FlgA n=1 Tax=Novosphingobium chloroacetimidivorans TaxID=1428314 RepID=A0A7W7K9N1_9SPHN|nr:flagella basal body P-ring formation protein FlgA [Novosphingobium chloroacetimidivorans]MBB4858133.1 flagella basal body P-ring formation protein FlgA [Novosphingobium chloroacetimidivorans]
MSIVLAILAAASSGYADLDTIDREVAGFTGAEIGQSGGAMNPVDRRLRLRPCGSPLALSWRTQNHESVVVQCGDPGSWRLFVPVKRETQGLGGTPVINRGDGISIAVNGEGFSVAQPGEAMEAGAVGAWIHVRPINAKPNAEAMRAQVVRPGLVSLPLD